MAPQTEKSYGRVVLAWVLGFFLTFILLDSYFVYLALSTHTGVTTERAYEQGLHYNNTLNQARTQEKLNIDEHVFYRDGALFWELKKRDGSVINNMQINGQISFGLKHENLVDISFKMEKPNLYTIPFAPDKKGVYTARLEATWDTHSYKTVHTFLVK